MTTNNEKTPDVVIGEKREEGTPLMTNAEHEEKKEMEHTAEEQHSGAEDTGSASPETSSPVIPPEEVPDIFKEEPKSESDKEETYKPTRIERVNANNDDFVRDLFGPVNITAIEREYDEDGDVISKKIVMESNRKTCTCPKCGKKCIPFTKSGRFRRTVQDIPNVPGQSLYYEFVGREFVCDHNGCSVHCFSEPFAVAPRFSRITVRLATLIICLCLLCVGLHSVETILRTMGVAMADSTISDMLREIPVWDDPDVEEIGVDDISSRKGQSYLTVIYSLKTGMPLAILRGRDGVELRKWLLKHPKVKLVCRDRASAYAAVIEEVFAGKEIIQIADRFHLFENIFDHLGDMIKSKMPDRIAIQNNTILDKVPSKAAWAEVRHTVEEMEKLHYDNSPVLDENGNPIVIDSRLTNPDSKQGRQQAASREQKAETAKNVRDAFLKLNVTALSKEQCRNLMSEFGISEHMVKKYIKMSDDDIENLRNPRINKHRANGMDDYCYIAYKMIRDGHDIPMVIQYIRRQNCTLADLTLINHILSICKHHFPDMDTPSLSDLTHSSLPDGVIVITRNDILKYLVTDDQSKLSPIVNKYYAIILEKYPICKEIQTIFTEFHDMVMGKCPEKLDEFIKKYQDVDFLSGFCGSLRHDTVAIKYAIVRSESSGVVEGSNCKIKLLKRSMYGRSGLDNLAFRAQLAFFLTSPIFSLSRLNPDLEWQKKLYEEDKFNA